MSEELPREEGLPSEEGLPERRICAVVQGVEPCDCVHLCFYLFSFSIIGFVLADVASGCVLFLLMVAFALAFTSAQKEDRCLMRAALLIYVLGLLLLVVAIVLLAMKTHRVTSLPDPTCEPWAGSCQEGGQRSDGRIECDDCSDEISTCVDLDGYWWSERGARYFPTGNSGAYWGWGRTRRLNRCGIPQEPSEGGTHGSLGGKDDEEQMRRWREAKETGDCRPLFTSQTKCEEYWGRWQDAWRGEWRGWLIGGLLFQALLLLCNIGLVQRGYIYRKSPVGAQTRPLPLGPPRPQRQQSDVQCSICLGPYKERAWTKCNHSFCRECITEVCRTNPPTNRAPCPFCRRPVLLGELTRLETTPMLANEAAQPVRDPQPESGVDAALGDAFTSQGRTNTISS